MSENLSKEGYKKLLEELKNILSKGRLRVYKEVDNILVETRWQMGERIVREELKYQDRAGYGDYLIKKLAADLNIKKQRLSEVIRFYNCYPIVRSLTGQLSWTHYMELIGLENEKERQFYEQKIIANSWSVRELTKQIKNKLYQNTDQKEVLTISKNVMPEITDVYRMFKPEYDLSFLSLPEKHLEKELEDRIVGDIENFLKELGSDFLFLGRQLPILIDGEKHFIDLVLFHRGIPCVVLVDLKAKKLDSRDIGQMNKYLGYFRRNRQYAYEQDAIGLIICSEIGQEEVIYALDGLEKKIFVSKYQTKLPSEEKIKKLISNL